MAASSVTGTGNGSAEKSLTKLVNGLVNNGNLNSRCVTANKIKFFQSVEIIGNGSAQSTAHGLGITPSLVIVYPTDTAPATAGAYTMTEGSHTSTNCVVTVTNGKKYRILALA